MESFCVHSPAHIFFYFSLGGSSCLYSLSFLESDSFTVKSTLFSPCSRSDPPHSCQGAALAHLDSLPPHAMILWTDSSVPFFLGKDGSSVLANCSLGGTEAILFFSAGPACSSFSAETCAILHALCWFRQHQQVCHFSSLLLSDSRSVLAPLSAPPSFLLPQTL